MTLRNERFQFAVGQGGFHAGRLIDDGELKITYVFDCGAMSTYQARRDECVEEYLNAGGAGADLDFLFISHAHADHLNGVEKLLRKKGGMKVKTIVMPLLNVVERLICYARTASADPKAAANGFYRDFTADPVKALSRFEPDQIFQLESGGAKGGAPFNIDDAGSDPDGPAFSLRPNELKPRTPLQMVGRGKVRPAKSGPGATKLGKVNASPQAWVAEDSVGFLLSATSVKVQWLLAPFVDPGVQADADAFLSALASEKKMTVADLHVWLGKVSNVKELITHGLPHLIAAYSEVAKDLNVTSLSLYSGPVPHDLLAATPTPQIRFFSGAHQYLPDHARVAWLGTGDAALKSGDKRKAFLEHYGNLLGQVCTLVLPHHGSEGNFDVELLDVIKPAACVAAADRFAKWRHPGSAVVQAVASAGKWLIVVTSAPVTAVSEHVAIS